MLIELAVGDAYGAGFEFAELDIIKKYNNLSQYISHPKHQHQAGAYTDDTQMSLAIAELLIEKQPWTPENIAEKFVQVFKRDPRQGYAKRFYQLLQTIDTGSQLLKKINWTSDKSGAAMRAAPLGILPTPQQVIDYTTTQASLTHKTPDGITAACAAALISHYFLYRLAPKKSLPDFLHNHVPSQNWSQVWLGPVDTKGLNCVKAALTGILQNNSMSELLQHCINYSGDVDTVAAIALAGSAASPEIEQNLPPQLLNNLEDTPYGKTYLQNLDQKLLQLLP